MLLDLILCDHLMMMEMIEMMILIDSKDGDTDSSDDDNH
jgi:hypothetical protein